MSSLRTQAVQQTFGGPETYESRMASAAVVGVTARRRRDGLPGLSGLFTR